MTTFDMPPVSASFADRGHWLIEHLMPEFGLLDFQAAGIPGNFGGESHLKAVQEISPLAGAGGFGWAQWTGPRRRAFEAFCAANGLDPHFDEGNYRFMLSELKVDYANSIAGLKRAKTVEEAVFSFGETYERPYGTTATYLPGNAARLAYAKEALGVTDRAQDDHKDRMLTMQTALQKLGLYTGDLDGLWGPKSRAALTAFNTEAY